MRRFSALIILSFLPAIILGQIIDHNCTNFLSIPLEYINQAKARLHIVYEHTSHGSQIIDGMTGLSNWKGSLYLWNNGGSNGALDIHDHGITGGSDLGSPNLTSWAASTRTYLRNPANSDVNVVMWAWCGQVSTATESNINSYISLMNALETEFPAVRFIYMTGHLDGTGVYGNLNMRNEQIRNYCRLNNKILFDFADIESYDPDGVYYLNKNANDNCDYDSNGDGTLDRNWATIWQKNHLVNIDWYNCLSAHSQPLNANRKAYAAWWMFARLAGWAGPVVKIPVSQITVAGYGGSSTITSNHGTLQLSAIVSPSNATSQGLTWTVQNVTGKATISPAGLVTAVANGTVTAVASSTDGSGVSGSLTITISNQFVPVTSITVSGSAGSTSIGIDNGTLQLTAAVLPSDASNRSVTWSVSGISGEASVNSSGLLTAITDGIVLVNAAAADGSGITGSLQILISNQVVPVENIILVTESGTTVIPEIRNTLQIDALVSPEVATIKTVSWSVKNITGKAEVSETGLVTGINEGIVEVIATAMDGTGINSSIEIDIKSVKGEPLVAVVNDQQIKIPLEGIYSGSNVSIYDFNGNRIASKPSDDAECVFQGLNLKPGLYIVTLANSIVLRTGKFVIPE